MKIAIHSPRLVHPEQAADFKKDVETIVPPTSLSKEDRRDGSGDRTSAGPTLKELLLTDTPRAEIPVPPRRQWRRRTPEPLE